MRRFLTRLLPRLALLIAGIACTLLIAEIAVRAWFGARGTEREKQLYLYDRATLDRQTTQLIGVPYLNYTLNPQFEEVNARGVRGELVAVPKPDGVFRIVALGGSTTFGLGLPAAEAWPAQLERILRDEYGYANVEVVNLGVPGYYSLDSLVTLAARGLAHEPDLVINYDGVNDVVIRMYQDPACYSGDTPLFGMGIDRGIWQSGGGELPPSALYRLLALQFGWMPDPTTIDGRMVNTGLCPPEPGNISPLELLAQNPPVHFERNLRGIAALAQSSGAQMVFSTFAWDVAAAEAVLAADPTADGTRALLNGVAEHNALVMTIAAETDSTVIDLAGEIGTGGVYFQGDQVHQTAEGAQRQAEIYAAVLDAAGVIRR